MKIICIFIFFSSATVFGQEEAPLISIPDGQLKGTVNLTYKENVTYYAYRGIPFAKKPVGNLRFAAPVKNDPWNGTLDATKDKDICTQLVNIISLTNPEVIGSEDCLYINVYTTNVNGSLPVMVWIYGGGFMSGSSAYEVNGPDYLLEKEVVFVAFNYRLGVFGFLSTEDSTATGNWGLKDQILALKWVKENIKYFGGDPEKVTIFGQSAGGASVSYLLQSSLTAGLYRSAILQSGTSLCLWALTHNARRRAFSVGAKLGIFTLNAQTLISNLRKTDYRALKLADSNVTAQVFLTENLLAGLPFGVVSEPDHPGAVFSARSWQLLSNGNFQKVPLIIGHTSKEGNALEVYVNQIRPILFQYELEITRLAPYDLTRNFLKRLAAGTAVRGHFFGLGSLGSQPNALVTFLSVDMFTRPAREAVILTSKFSQVYYYEFSYKGRLGDPNNTFSGVGHAEELRYLFVVKNQPISAQDATTIQRFVTLWTNFAKTGNPTPSSDAGNGSVLGTLVWQPNNSSTNASSTVDYLNINDTLAVDTNPFQVDWEFYQNLYNRYGDPPYTTY